MSIVTRFADAFNRQDVDALVDCFTEDATFEGDADSGSTIATVTAARRLPRKAPSSTSTSTVASISAFETVPTAFSTSVARL